MPWGRPSNKQDLDKGVLVFQICGKKKKKGVVGGLGNWFGRRAGAGWNLPGQSF